MNTIQNEIKNREMSKNELLHKISQVSGYSHLGTIKRGIDEATKLQEQSKFGEARDTFQHLTNYIEVLKKRDDEVEIARLSQPYR